MEEGENMLNGVVTNCKAVNLRSKTNKESEIIAVLEAGTKVVVPNANIKNGFYRVRLEDGVTGYIMAEYVELIDAEG